MDRMNQETLLPGSSVHMKWSEEWESLPISLTLHPR